MFYRACNRACSDIGKKQYFMPVAKRLPQMYACGRWRHGSHTVAVSWDISEDINKVFIYLFNALLYTIYITYLHEV